MRELAGEPMPGHARRAFRTWQRERAKAEIATEVADDARRRLDEMHKEACDRFGMDVPCDALLLDVLALVEVEGDRWLWQGTRNNKGMATIRAPRGVRYSGEISLVRYLAIEFGLIEPDTFGLLYPTNGDLDDVNPWHRTMRYADAPVGNPDRYRFGANAQ